MAFAFVVPDSAAAWSLDVVSIMSGRWGCVLSSCFVHSGLLPLMVRGLVDHTGIPHSGPHHCTTKCATCMQLSLPVLEESGAAIELEFGKVTLLIHMGMAGLGCALAQLHFQASPYGIAGTSERGAGRGEE